MRLRAICGTYSEPLCEKGLRGPEETSRARQVGKNQVCVERLVKCLSNSQCSRKESLRLN